MKIQDLKELVNAAREQRFPEFEKQFNTLMHEKTQQHVRAKEVEVAASFFAGSEQK